MTNVSRPPPRDRSGFRIAIICVLKAELDAVEGLFDQFWEPDHNYGKAEKDPIVYRTGRIGAHDVVLVFLPGKGNIHSATVASSLRSSFNNIRLCLVVGTCGGSPLTVEDEQEIILGDVVISTGVVYADFGQEFCDELVMDDNLQHLLGRPNLEIRAFLNKLSSMRSNSQLRSDTFAYLSQLLQKKNYEAYRYPGADKDKLYEKTYRHQHHIPTQCSICSKCADLRDLVCNHSRALTCDELLCDDNMLVRRRRLHDGDAMANNSQLHIVEPLIHLGLVASSDQTVRSAILRQKLFNEKGVIAFEMEGAGVWDTFPTVVIKGVCNYADSHKTRGWQKYASATAAACMKALLRQWSVVDQPRNVQSELDVSLKHLQMFRTQNYEDQKFRIPRLAQGAFQEWLQFPSYLSWLSSNEGCLLCVTGDPGRGKSLLARKLVDDFYEQGYSTCYFFFKRGGDDNQDSAAAALCAILHQLFCKHRELLEYANKYIEENGSKLCTLFRPLWDILTQIACRSRIGTVMCVIDGIDECKDSDRSILIEALEDFHTSSRNKPQTGSIFKFLATRRPIRQQAYGPATNTPEVDLMSS